MDAQATCARGVDFMAEDESLLTNPPTQEVAVHVRDYSRFTKLFKYGAIVCFIIAMLVVFIIS
jgi:hypothetical protein